MKKLVKFTSVVLFVFTLNSCEYVDLEGLSSEQIVEGLKEALRVGTDSATTSLAVTNGYYLGDVVNVKIPLPEQAENVRQIITDNNSLSNYINLDSYFEKVVLSVNRAAETAATEAGPIFWNAITNLSITDAKDILEGQNPHSTNATYDSTAATEYFRYETTASLTAVFAPYIDNALGDDLGLGFSAVDAWGELTTRYNNTLNSISTTLAILGLGDLLPQVINDDLGEFCTEKALDGLFFMVGQEEKKIRQDPWQYANDVIEDVWGSLF